MATMVLSAAGAAIGGGFGGSVLGLSGAVIGRAVGATIGQVIDQRIMGAGSKPVETGRIDRLRLVGASEGAPVGMVWGRMRVAGQVIWASRFREQKRTTGGGGKGSPPEPEVTEYTYSVSLAIALCEGVITRVGRIWADGVEISREDLQIRVYRGTETQQPDPKVEAVEGAGKAPAYRGIAYVVLEDLGLGRFGNRVPQLSFEVVRAAQGPGLEGEVTLAQGVQGVALIPGTGEYALATTPVHYSDGLGGNVSANVHSPAGGTDFRVATRALAEELPACSSVSLVVSWFADDLRAGSCRIRPKVEDKSREGVGMPWRSGGIGRAAAQEVVKLSGRPAYGGTPADAAVIEAIGHLKAKGKSVVFYPFILMEQGTGNGLPDPWGDSEQAAFPWRGRITTSIAPGLPGSPSSTAGADAEVAAFFGSAGAGDFSWASGEVRYAGPAEWSYRRFILHYAQLCAAAGGVDAFCIGSEMRGLTEIMGATGFPAVAQLRALAADVRLILGPLVKIGYAADWTEYSGVQDGTGGRHFHLDPLWSDANIDFIGIDNYMPLSDWRDGQAHADSPAGSIYDLRYLRANVAGGEGFDWYYASDADRDAQVRTPVTDGAEGEPWVWRYKDIRSWWENAHYDRPGGVRQSMPTAWVPRSKPIWFTEFGCPAVDKATNEPNKFIDPKSSESVLPRFSNGRRDDLIQMQYLRAMLAHWSDPAENPVSDVYGGRMVDLSRAHVWAWDARPYPQFPNQRKLWSDGENYRLGHWLNGRATAQPLAAVVAEICRRAGVLSFDVSGLFGLVRGYTLDDTVTGRTALQPLMLAYGFDAVERDGVLGFRMRGGAAKATLDPLRLALDEDGRGGVETTRAGEVELAGRVRLSFVEAQGDYETRAVEAVLPDETAITASKSEMPLALTDAEARLIAERWLGEARVARDGARFVLPPSRSDLGAGDIVALAQGGGTAHYRIDRIEQAGALAVEAVRVEAAVVAGRDAPEGEVDTPEFLPPMPLLAQFMDLPLLSGSEVAHAPHLAVTSFPWSGGAAVFRAAADSGYVLDQIISGAASIGVTETGLEPARPGEWDRGASLRVRFGGTASLTSASEDAILNGANLIAIGDGSPDKWELFQFRDAVLVGQGTYDLAFRLRGLCGTEHLAGSVWPPGSRVVVVDAALRQIGLSFAERDLERHYRIGPSTLPYGDPAYQHIVAAFAGVGLRPYSPVHLCVARAGGDRTVSWVRRTRIGGDSWSGTDVPLGEAAELYVVRVVRNGMTLREVTTGVPQWTYTGAMAAQDGATTPFEFHVAQVSESFGPGPFGKVSVND